MNNIEPSPHFSPTGGWSAITHKTFLPTATRYLQTVLQRYQPTAVAIEEPYYAQARSSALLQKLTTETKDQARRQGAAHIRAYLPTTVKTRFCTGKRTRQNLADAMTQRYWFLYDFVKPNRTKHYWSQMFDAVALGTLAVEDLIAGRKSSR